MAISILLYDDNVDLRASLSTLINFSDGLNLVGAFENCSQVLKHIDELLPDIILMDIDMPVINGIEALKQIRKEYEDLPVVMMTVFDDNQHILDAIMEGATGYILKSNLSERLVSAINEAKNGGAPMSPAVARLVLKQIMGTKKNREKYALTPKEKEILQLLVDGNSYKMIADQACIASGTVTSHIKNIYGKLGVHSQAEAVSKALREGLI